MYGLFDTLFGGETLRLPASCCIKAEFPLARIKKHLRLWRVISKRARAARAKNHSGYTRHVTGVCMSRDAQ